MPGLSSGLLSRRSPETFGSRLSDAVALEGCGAVLGVFLDRPLELFDAGLFFDQEGLPLGNAGVLLFKLGVISETIFFCHPVEGD